MTIPCVEHHIGSLLSIFLFTCCLFCIKKPVYDFLVNVRVRIGAEGAYILYTKYIKSQFCFNPIWHYYLLTTTSAEVVLLSSPSSVSTKKNIPPPTSFFSIQILYISMYLAVSVCDCVRLCAFRIVLLFFSQKKGILERSVINITINMINM